jgi:hypothetical protein
MPSHISPFMANPTIETMSQATSSTTTRMTIPRVPWWKAVRVRRTGGGDVQGRRVGT